MRSTLPCGVSTPSYATDPDPGLWWGGLFSPGIAAGEDGTSTRADDRAMRIGFIKLALADITPFRTPHDCAQRRSGVLGAGFGQRPQRLRSLVHAKTKCASIRRE